MVMQNYTKTIYVDDQEPFLEADNLNKGEDQLKKLTDNLRNVQISLESGQVAEAIVNLQQSIQGILTNISNIETAISMESNKNALSFAEADRKIGLNADGISTLGEQLAGKISAPSDPQEGDILIYKSGNWTSEAPIT